MCGLRQIRAQLPDAYGAGGTILHKQHQRLSTHLQQLLVHLRRPSRHQQFVHCVWRVNHTNIEPLLEECSLDLLVQRAGQSQEKAWYENQPKFQKQRRRYSTHRLFSQVDRSARFHRIELHRKLCNRFAHPSRADPRPTYADP